MLQIELLLKTGIYKYMNSRSISFKVLFLKPTHIHTNDAVIDKQSSIN